MAGLECNTGSSRMEGSMEGKSSRIFAIWLVSLWERKAVRTCAFYYSSRMSTLMLFLHRLHTYLNLCHLCVSLGVQRDQPCSPRCFADVCSPPIYCHLPQRLDYACLGAGTVSATKAKARISFTSQTALMGRRNHFRQALSQLAFGLPA